MMQRFAFVILGILLVSCSKEQPPCVDVFANHLREYPAMRGEDLYKLAYQAAMGPGHLARDSVRMKAYLFEEYSGLKPDTTIPLAEVISPDSLLVRLNLKRLKAEGGSPEFLASAFIRTTERMRPSREKLEQYLLCALIAAGRKSTTFSVDSLKIFITQQRENGFPAVHHTEQYLKAYDPAYRVILREYVDSLGVVRD